MNEQMKAPAFILVIAIFVGGCVGHPAALAPACEQPAPLDGKWDPKTPGYIIMFTKDVDDSRALLMPWPPSTDSRQRASSVPSEASLSWN
jgi:hypothetical protein